MRGRETLGLLIVGSDGGEVDGVIWIRTVSDGAALAIERVSVTILLSYHHTDYFSFQRSLVLPRASSIISTCHCA
jgi:hypothetical protein